MSIFNKQNLSSMVKSALTILVSVLIIFTVVKAGTITPPSGGSEPIAKFYTISEIYTRLTTNAAATEAVHDFTFSDGLVGTGRTLTEIYNAIPVIVANTVKLGTTYLGVAGTLVPSGGDAAPANVLSGKTFFGSSQADWNTQTGIMANIGGQTINPSTSNSTITQGYHDGTGYCSGDADLISGNILSGKTIFGVAGNSNVIDTSSGDAIAGNILTDKKAWVDGAEITGSAAAGANVSGSNSSLSFAVPDGLYSGSKTCTASDTNLTVSNIKKGTSIFGTTGVYSGYPGTVWTGTPAMTQAACDAQNGSGWYWFEDGNGDGDTTDPEDGLCVKTTAGTAGSWNGDFFATQRDNSYIAAYTCSGSFPSGTVATYSGIDVAGAADTTFNNGDCALCQADCYDGQKDLPDQGGYATPSEAITGNGGPITPEVLKNWKGTRLPTSNDFFGFCGATSGDIDSTAGDSAYHSSGASSSKTIGNYGGNAGRGSNSAPNDEYADLSNSGSWEWLSEQHYSTFARGAGAYACSNFVISSVFSSYRFRAVFRP